MRHVLLVLSLLAVGCGSPCKGQYSQTDAQGNLHKFNQYQVDGVAGCVTDNVPVTQWEASSQARIQAKVSCIPQPLTQTLVAQDNFYAYRDSRLYLDLNGATGEYRRLTLAEGKDGTPLFTRLQACFYVRDGQLLLDTVNSASSQFLDPMEIFTYTSDATSMAMVRYDDSQDWNYQFCPVDSTNWGFCDLLRTGNSMYNPDLGPADQASLLHDALLIRKTYNYADSSVAQFDSLWDGQGRTEATMADYKFAVSIVVDEPKFTSMAWKEFVMGQRPTMPDTTSSNLPPICWPSSRSITFADGSTGKVYGEACLTNGVYTFTQ